MTRLFRPASATPRGGRWTVLTMVLGILAALALGPGIAPATAGGFDCKEVPAPEAPAMAEPVMFDPDSAHKQDPNDHTGYGSYGWAGLRWYVYDLGCGEDITRSPKAVADTELGNSFFRTGQEIAAAAFWMDRQATTPDEASRVGRTSFLAEFDKLIVTTTEAVRDNTYGKFMSIALVLVGAVILWRGLRADIASVTKSALLGGTALLVGAVFLGAPQQAIKISDDTFAQLITDQQATIFDKTGTTGKPRDVVLDQILLPDYTKGWFGDLDTANAHNLEPQIRDALALSYDEQQQIRKDRSAANKIREDKKKKFQAVVSGLEDNGLSYYTFQGKDSHRVGTGLMSMIKVSTISLLWIGASLLKLAALFAIRLAILTAPIWIPVAAVHGGLMERVLRGLLGAYLWGVAAAVLLAVYMLFIVRLYGSEVALSSAWKFWVTVIMTVFCWMVMRPFKRISSLARQNNTSVFNRHSVRRKAMALAQFTGAGQLARIADRVGGQSGGSTTRPEGTTVQRAQTEANAQKERVAQQIATGMMADHYRRRHTETQEYWRAKEEDQTGPIYAHDVPLDAAGRPSPGGRVGNGRLPVAPRRDRNEDVVFISIKGQSGRQPSANRRSTEPTGSSSMVWDGQLWIPPVSRDVKAGVSAPKPSRDTQSAQAPSPKPKPKVSRDATGGISGKPKGGA
ncbi:hypothetical protein [Nocardia wallacei]|uniref:hypothetical protein n=1 Tax=Nocardia wallacei TaxID=480035 RepID=UPI002455969F|nr:hypothetical protein [Nocardia wallacei]